MPLIFVWKMNHYIGLKISVGNFNLKILTWNHLNGDRTGWTANAKKHPIFNERPFEIKGWTATTSWGERPRHLGVNGHNILGWTAKASWGERPRHHGVNGQKSCHERPREILQRMIISLLEYHISERFGPNTPFQNLKPILWQYLLTLLPHFKCLS